jgi:hypothetical protein
MNDRSGDFWKKIFCKREKNPSLPLPRMGRGRGGVGCPVKIFHDFLSLIKGCVGEWSFIGCQPFLDLPPCKRRGRGEFLLARCFPNDYNLLR